MSDTQIDRAMESASSLRVLASQYRQIGFPELAKEMLANAKLAEKWAVQQAKGGWRW